MHCTHLKEGFIKESTIAVFSTSWCYADPLLIALSHKKIIGLRACTKAFACNFFCEGSVYSEYSTCRYCVILWLNLSEDIFFFSLVLLKMIILAFWYSAWSLCTLHSSQKLQKIWAISFRRKKTTHFLLVLALILLIPDLSGSRW